MTGSCRYLRYVSDFAFDDWHRRNIHRVVEELNEEGINVSVFVEGEIEYDDMDEKIYHAILVYGKPIDPLIL